MFNYKLRELVSNGGFPIHRRTCFLALKTCFIKALKYEIGFYVSEMHWQKVTFSTLLTCSKLSSKIGLFSRFSREQALFSEK